MEAIPGDGVRNADSILVLPLCLYNTALSPRNVQEPRAPVVPRTLNAELIHRLSAFRGNKQQVPC